MSCGMQKFTPLLLTKSWGKWLHKPCHFVTWTCIYNHLKSWNLPISFLGKLVSRWMLSLPGRKRDQEGVAAAMPSSSVDLSFFLCISEARPEAVCGVVVAVRNFVPYLPPVHCCVTARWGIGIEQISQMSGPVTQSQLNPCFSQMC